MQAEGHQQRMQYEQEQGYEDEQAGVDEPLPDFGQVDGTTIKLSGLDYSMIKAETAKERKKDLLANIKNKIGQFAHRMPVNVTLPRSNKTSQNDQLTKNIELIAKTKPTINASTFYLFPTNPNFSPLVPQTITRRFGKMHAFPLFIQHESKYIDEFKHLIIQDDRIKEHRKQQHLEASKIVPELASDGDDSDDIFGKDSEEEDREKRPKIKIGNKLSLGVNQQEIFGKKSYNEAVKEEKQVQVAKKDKYDFLRKKVKPNQDAYGQCFPDADL